MGFVHPIAVHKELTVTIPCPAKEDKFLYVPRYIKDGMEAEKTDTFVSRHISKR